MPRPFRFGLHFWQLPAGGWVDEVRRYEALGFSTVTFTDHVMVPQFDPLTAAASITAVTDRLHTGSLVLDMGIRNPVLVAKAAATIHVMSGGRFELGLGAGYVKANFRAAGAEWLTPGRRLARLEESVGIIRRLWADESTTVQSDHFDIEGAPRSLTDPIDPGDLPILVGGGGPKAMAVAGRCADIVSLIPRQPSGDWSVPDSIIDSTDDRLAEKVAWARAAAEGSSRRDPLELEFNTMVFRTAIGGDVSANRRRLAEQDGVPVESTVDSSLFLTGSPAEVRERLLARRERFGLTYYSFFDPGPDQVDLLANEILSPLNEDGELHQ